VVTIILANKFVELNYNVSIIYLWERKRNDMPIIDSRIKQYAIPGILEPKKPYNISKQNLKLMIKFINQYIKDNKVDIIINQWWPAKLVYNAKRGRNIGLICCHHMNVIQKTVIKTLRQKIFYFLLGEAGVNLRKYLFKNRLSESFKYSDKWVMLCDSFVDECKELFSITNEDGKICAIPNPLPYKEFISKSEIHEKDKIILCVGRIDENHKRISYIIKIWNEICHKIEYKDWKLYIVGDGIDLENMKKYAMALNCQRIYFEGHQNPLKYYKQSSIFVMASSIEGLPMTLMEAQQNGCVPIVMDTFASLHDIIENGINGLIVEDNNIQEFIKALESVMLNDAYRLELIYNGLKTCERFSIDNIIECWISLFYKIKAV
jgi:glycosyltransferase involved in cell wall biosynthesis